MIAEKSLADEQGETKYYFAMLPADTPLQRLGELAHSRWTIEQFYEDAKGECGLGDFQGRRWDGFHRHLALVMVAYSFLMLESSVAGGGEPSQGEGFPPSVRQTTLPAIHRRVLEWLLEDLVLWLIETNRIKTFRPRRI